MVGIPKTVDNDLAVTDCCPGFGSVAKYTAVSVLEAMAHGCVPLLSDLPANHELVQDRANGWIVPDTLQGEDLQQRCERVLPALLQRAADIARSNREWVRQHGLFAPAVQNLVHTLQAFE